MRYNTSMISAIVLAKNEAESLPRCLTSLEWCDEIIVIDDNSTDASAAIARKHGAIVFKKDLLDDFSAQRNFGLSKAKNKWVLFVDADEVVSDRLQEEIRKVLTIDNRNGYLLKRTDIMWGRELRHGECGNVRLLRLAKKNAGQWKGNVHETWEVKGQVGHLHHALLHYPHQSITAFLQEINFYTTLRAKELYAEKTVVSWITILAYPKAKFIYNYIIRGGVLDGIPGLLVALCMSFHSFLVRSKLWLLYRNEK